MKTFYCVMIEKYADGRVKAAVAERNCRNMPKNQTRHLPGVDAYTTWYENISQATVALEKVKKEIAA
jgi:hypothetical protein